MVEDDKFTKMAKADFKIRLVSGFIVGLIASIIAIVLIIVFLVMKKPELAGMMTLILLAGLITGGSCGFFLFRKGDQPQDSDKKEEKE